MCALKIKEALDRAIDKNKKKIELKDSTKLAIFSDLHRGVGDWADDFMHNCLIFESALNYYYDNGFTYVELGDGDELYENRKLIDIVVAYAKIFWLLSEFDKAGRLCFILGNHNLQMGNDKWLRKALEEARAHIPGLFPKIEIFETAMLGDKIFMFHGHQGDLINDRYVSVGRFWVRRVWRPLQSVFGFKDPTRPAESIKKRSEVENAILAWASDRRIIAIAGHTHRPMFYSLSKQQKAQGQKASPYYFNCGCGVFPRYVTCLEVYNMSIELIKWHVIADVKDNRRLRVEREPIAGCKADINVLISQL